MLPELRQTARAAAAHLGPDQRRAHQQERPNRTRNHGAAAHQRRRRVRFGYKRKKLCRAWAFILFASPGRATAQKRAWAAAMAREHARIMSQSAAVSATAVLTWSSWVACCSLTVSPCTAACARQQRLLPHRNHLRCVLGLQHQRRAGLERRVRLHRSAEFAISRAEPAAAAQTWAAQTARPVWGLRSPRSRERRPRRSWAAQSMWSSRRVRAGRRTRCSRRTAPLFACPAAAPSARPNNAGWANLANIAIGDAKIMNAMRFITPTPHLSQDLPSITYCISRKSPAIIISESGAVSCGADRCAC